MYDKETQKLLGILEKFRKQIEELPSVKGEGVGLSRSGGRCIKIYAEPSAMKSEKQLKENVQSIIGSKSIDVEVHPYEDINMFSN
ncbi:hypothetical protein [Rubinisphaera sp.]|uniref:hypothetical protein n=1 Tax=Rubinisphaera sp. TaxID=2024857 RepID=UPI0025D91E94|nr:hypothetical protein [Rubinisphaera sp.]